MDFDAIVVGSGFGGSVMTCRLAEQGKKVCLLERGKQYGFGEFPRQIHDIKDKLFWDPDNDKYGYMEVRNYPDSDTATVFSAGLGGGSLIYANVLYKVPDEFFAGWPAPLSGKLLQPYYQQAMDMLEAQQYPFEREGYSGNRKAELLQEAFTKIEPDADFLRPPKLVNPHVAIRYQGDFPGHQSNNNQGVLQSSCTGCGECDIGCNIHAKNTLDLNYLARAQNTELMGEGSHAATIKTHAEVTAIEPLEADSGYRVTWQDPRTKQVETATATRVVLSAGSIGSTALLLKMKKRGLLPKLSERLGQGWSGNGDVEGTVILPEPLNEPTKGPVITTSIEYSCKPYPDGFAHGMLIQDASFPNFLAWFAAGKMPSPGSWWATLKMLTKLSAGKLVSLFGGQPSARWSLPLNLGGSISELLDSDNFIRKVVLLLGMGRDRSNGVVSLNKNDQPIVTWKLDASKLHYDRARREMKKLAEAMGGRYLDSPLTHLNKLIAVHPLGGCVMGETEQQGVVNSQGEVFNYPGLFVVDGSIMPTSLGPNPSLTITAIAEYMAEQMVEATATRSK